MGRASKDGHEFSKVCKKKKRGNSIKGRVFFQQLRSQNATLEQSEKGVKELVIEDFFIWSESNVALQSFHGGSHVDRMWLLVTIGIQKGTVLSIYFRTIKKSIKVTN